MKLLVLGALFLCAVALVQSHPGHEHEHDEHEHYHYHQDDENEDDHHHAHSHDEHSHDHAHSHDHGHDHEHSHDHGHSHDHDHEHSHDHAHSHDHSHDHEHSHDHGHDHEHSHDHSHSHSHSHSHEEEEDASEFGQVNELTPDTIFEKIDSHEFVIIEFYAPWCGACKKFAPEYEIAAEKLKERAYFGKFDAWNEKYAEVTKAYDVSGYPTIFFFSNGNRDGVQYLGELNAAALVSTVEKKLRPDFVALSSIDEVKTFSTLERVTIVGFFEDTSSSAYDTFIEFAKNQKEAYLFGVAVGVKGAAQEFGISLPSAVFFKAYDQGNKVLEGKEFSQLEEFVLTHKFPLLAEIGKTNSKLYVDAAIPIAFFFVETQEQRDQYAPILRTLAKETRKKVNFVFIDWTKYGGQAKKLALSGTKVPSLALEDTKLQIHWAFDETKELTIENIRAWIQQFLSGELQPTVISEPLPEDNTGPVTIVVGKNFEEIVLDDSKHVFVDFYAPWCGHCKSLVPVWDQLGKVFASSQNIVIAKMDATANYFDMRTKINMYPTLKLFKAGDKANPIQFSGKEKDLHTLVEFVLSETGTGAIVDFDSAEAQSGKQKDEL